MMQNMEQQKNSVGKIIYELCRGTGRREDSLLAELPAAASRSMRPSYLPHAVHSRSILSLSFVILSQHLSSNKPWCPEMCPRVASIGKCRAPRVNDDSLSARHCITECLYSIYPGTKVWGSSAVHRSLQIREASCLLCAIQKSRPEGRPEIIKC